MIETRVQMKQGSLVLGKNCFIDLTKLWQFGEFFLTNIFGFDFLKRLFFIDIEDEPKPSKRRKS